jgi:hypothetical protein
MAQGIPKAATMNIAPSKVETKNVPTIMIPYKANPAVQKFLGVININALMSARERREGLRLEMRGRRPSVDNQGRSDPAASATRA